MTEISGDKIIAASREGSIVVVSLGPDSNTTVRSNLPLTRIIQAGSLWTITCYGDLLATANQDGSVKVWNMCDG